MTVTAGSQLSAGVAPATLKFYRGGQVRICPRSRISVNSDGRGVMLGMDAGMMEVDLQIDQNSTDIVFTPDLTIRLAAGVYHFALGVTGQGDTCFKPLPGNASGIVLSELAGSEEFGIAADQNAFFPGGNLGARTALTSECGCPPPPPVLKAEATPSTPLASPQNPANAVTHSVTQSEPRPAASPESAQPSHLAVQAPFVFSANAPPAPARVEYSALPNLFLAQEDIDPAVLPLKDSAPAIDQKKPTSAAPAADNPGKKEKKGFMSRLKGFFTGLFHR